MNIIKTNYIIFISFLENVKKFLGSLTTIDIIFFFAVVLLMILLVTLLYFIKSNEDYVDEKPANLSQIESAPQEEEKVQDNIKLDNFVTDSDNAYDEEGELLDLETITKALENKEPSTIDLTRFEEEQERDAIISYDELLRKSTPNTFSYKNEKMLDDLSVKEIDLNSLNSSYVEPTHSEVKSISYQEEEDFLDALKELQKSLN